MRGLGPCGPARASCEGERAEGPCSPEDPGLKYAAPLPALSADGPGLGSATPGRCGEGEAAGDPGPSLIRSP